MIPGELHTLLERCRAEEAPAWERFAAWVAIRGRAVLRGVDRLSAADGEDALAETLKTLVAVVRRGEIRGVSNAEIDAYVCTAIRNRALNALRGRTRRSEIDGWATEAQNSNVARGELADRVPDAAPSQEAQVITAQLLERRRHCSFPGPRKTAICSSPSSTVCPPGSFSRPWGALHSSSSPPSPRSTRGSIVFASA